MGGKEKPVCLDCEKSQQKDLPSNDNLSSSGQPCEDVYQHVSDCMKQHNGKVAPCSKEWDAFQKCHAENRARR
jgi:hypothetical protein